MALPSPHSDTIATPLNPSPHFQDDHWDLHELLTVEDVAALLKVSRSWVYEHTRSRGTARIERLPYIKIGKYKRFDPRSVREFLVRRAKAG
jgi:predicted DNA-binding transcriptional regulator AlpA